MRQTWAVPRMLWVLLENNERLRLLGLCLVVLVMSLAQVIGVGSVAPFVSVIMNPDSIETNRWINMVYIGLGFDAINTFIIFLALVVMSAVLLANSLLALTHFLMVRFGWALQYRLSKRLLQAYIDLPYEDTLNRNSADTG